VALVSSSPHEWIDPLLRNVELRDHFDAVFTRDQVRRVKPDPELYGVALDALGLDPGQALALEDSPNGLAAAVASGVPCVAVPGPMTRGLDFSAAELCLESLDERALPDVLALLASR
jgi:putative hydrolase of the HAD superfamily